MLGSKTLGTNVLELQFVLYWQTMIKTLSLGLGLLKVCLFVKLESSDCKIYWTKSTRLDRSNLVQIYFSAKSCLMCEVLCLTPSINGKTLATF